MKYLFCFLSLLCALNLPAQDLNVKKHLKLAESLLDQGRYLDAADHFKMAFKQKPNKFEYLYKAAEAYFEAKDYQKSEIAYRQLKKEFDVFPGSELMYARCLKQQGLYEEAKEAFSSFIDKYSEPDKPLFTRIVKTEIEGCNLAIAKGVDKNENELSIEYVSNNINSNYDDFAPIPFADDILYFSTIDGNSSKILRSQKALGEWTKPVAPKFPKMPEGHIANGSFSPDGKRFYFTVCQTVSKWRGLKSDCDLHVILNNNGKWAEPIALRTYLKMDGSTATHPHVVHEDGKEILYFSSNRSDGKGGMDIWYTTRKLDSEDFDFSFPKNAGSKINTLGDEITPYYDDSEGKLYFSSNGHPGFGGFDIFAAGGSQNKWTEPNQLDAPINSPSEDLYYVKTPSKHSGFIVSNRLTGVERMVTTEYDIFYYSSQNLQEAYVYGKVIDKNAGMDLEETQVVLYEFKEFGEERLLSSKLFTDGQFSFKVLPNKEYKVEASKDGYLPKSYIFSTHDFDKQGYKKDLILEPSDIKVLAMEEEKEPLFESVEEEEMVASNIDPVEINESPIVSPQATIPAQDPPARASEPKEEEITFEAPEEVFVAVEPPKEERVNLQKTPVHTHPQHSEENYAEYDANAKQAYSPVAVNPTTGKKNYTNSRYKNDGVTTSAPRLEGTYYKIQLTVVLKFDENHSSYNRMKEYGRLDTEYIIEKEWIRVLVADFFTISEAREVMRQAQINGFPEAFLVKYVDGIRKN